MAEKYGWSLARREESPSIFQFKRALIEEKKDKKIISFKE